MVWEEFLNLLVSNLRILPDVADTPTLGLFPQSSLVPSAFLAELGSPWVPPGADPGGEELGGSYPGASSCWVTGLSQRRQWPVALGGLMSCG